MPEIRVQDEQGNVHVFPDGSTPEMIAKVMNVSLPTQSQAAPSSTMDKVTHGLKEFGEQLNPVSAIKGINQLFYHPIDTLKGDAAQRQQIWQKGKEAYEKGNYTEAAAHFLYGAIPLAGPNLERSGEQFQQGDIAGGVGSSLGQGVAMAAPEAIKGVNLRLPTPEALAQRMYQSALKPSTTLSSGQVKNLVNTGIEARIPVSAEGVTKLTNLIQDYSDKVKAEIQSGTKSGATIDPQAVAQRADAVKSQFATQVNPGADIAAIDAAKQEFLKNNPNPIPAAEAQALKQGTYTQLKGKYGELSSASTEAQKALARGIKEELENQFPEIKGLNASQAKLIGLDSALERAVRRIDNHQLFGIGTPIAAGAGAAVGGAPGAAAAGILKYVLDQPEFKSKLAIALNHAGGTGIPINAAMARVAGYSTALGNAMPSDNRSQPAP